MPPAPITLSPHVAMPLTRLRDAVRFTAGMTILGAVFVSVQLLLRLEEAMQWRTSSDPDPR